MKKLQDLINGLAYELVKGSMSQEVVDIKDNSQLVEAGDLFLAVVGTVTDSHNYIAGAIENGAKVIVIEKDMVIDADDVTVIRVVSSREALTHMSRAFYDFPDEKLCMVGITGTCGKTSVSYIMRNILELNGDKVGVIGSIGAFVGDVKTETKNTTPNPYEIQKLLHMMVEAGCKYCIMEVSSQGLKMDRVRGIQFDYGIFTNLSVDHIGENEHENYEEYRYCKSLLFEQSDKGIINIDSEDSPYMMKQKNCEYITFGLEKKADMQATDVEFVSNDEFLGMGFTVLGKTQEEFVLSIPGKFSVYNALCAITFANAEGISNEVIGKALRDSTVEGRMEVVSSNERYKVIVDYAHNLEEITKLMETIAEYKPTRLISVFGCGGNRSKDRRYANGEVIGKYADLSVITEDNPRFETFEDINNDILVGMNRSNGKYVIIKDRKEAIKMTIKEAQKGDLILLIGKGHENYQEIKGEHFYWSEKEAVYESEMELRAE